MLPFLPLHALAAKRGDGLRPELLALLARRAKSTPGLRAPIAPESSSANEGPPDPSRADLARGVGGEP